MAALLILHVLASVVVGWAGRNRKFGFFGFFLLSLLLTPLLAIILLFIASPGAGYRTVSETRRR